MGAWRRRVMIFAAFTGAAMMAMAAVACGGGSGSAYGGSSSSPTVKAAATSSSAGVVAAATSSDGGANGYGSTPGGSASGGAGFAVGNTSLGSVLVDGTGMTLYLFAKDTAGSGKSACAGACATNWPPLTVTGVPAKPTGATGTLATITRDDGSVQLTYNGMPLYRYAADKAAGDTKGDGVGGVWSVAKP